MPAWVMYLLQSFGPAFLNAGLTMLAHVTPAVEGQPCAPHIADAQSHLSAAGDSIRKAIEAQAAPAA